MLRRSPQIVIRKPSQRNRSSVELQNPGIGLAFGQASPSMSIFLRVAAIALMYE